jgi:hypothetical protein
MRGCGATQPDTIRPPIRRDAWQCTRSPRCNDRIQPKHQQGRGHEARLIEPGLAKAYASASLIGDAGADVYDTLAIATGTSMRAVRQALGRHAALSVPTGTSGQTGPEEKCV